MTADNPAWDGQPAFSPDGLQLAYLAMDRPGFEADRFHLALLNLKSGVKRPSTRLAIAPPCRLPEPLKAPGATGISMITTSGSGLLTKFSPSS